jgi:glycosyltransferase involved in cell wall biosynthesis
MRSEDSRVTIVLIQMSIDSYRQKFLEELSYISRLRVYVGKHHFSDQVRTRIDFDYEQVNNLFFLKRRFSFQVGVLRAGVLSNKVVIEMNPRVLSNWLILTLRRILCKKSTLWGHFFGRKDNITKQGWGRRTMIMLAGGNLIAYTEIEANRFRQHWPKRKVAVAPNSLVRESEISFNEGTKRHDFVYSGRLSKDKDPEILLRAFGRFIFSNESASKLHIVGDGELELNLKLLASKLSMADRVVFHGFISDHDQLKQIYESCIAGVTGGFVGLSAVQALGFGVPLIYPLKGGLAHAPEVSLLNSENSIPTSNDYLGFASAMNVAYINREILRQRGPMIASELRSNHTVERMSIGFLNGI